MYVRLLAYLPVCLMYVRQLVYLPVCLNVCPTTSLSSSLS